MKNHINLLIAVVGLSISGCGNFNTYLLPNYVVLPSEGKSVVVEPEIVLVPMQKEPTSVSDDKVLCPMFQMPTLPKIPELPLKELSRVAPTDMAAMDRIQIKHIEELREYSSKYRHAVAAAYKKYLETCREHSTAR